MKVETGEYQRNFGESNSYIFFFLTVPFETKEWLTKVPMEQGNAKEFWRERPHVFSHVSRITAFFLCGVQIASLVYSCVLDCCKNLGYMISHFLQVFYSHVFDSYVPNGVFMWCQSK